MKVGAVAVIAPSKPDDAMPSNEVVHRVNQGARKQVRSRAYGADGFMAACRKAVEDNEGIFHFKVEGREAIYVREGTTTAHGLRSYARGRTSGHGGNFASITELYCC